MPDEIASNRLTMRIYRLKRRLSPCVKKSIALFNGILKKKDKGSMEYLLAIQMDALLHSDNSVCPETTRQGVGFHGTDYIDLAMGNEFFDVVPRALKYIYERHKELTDEQKNVLFDTAHRLNFFKLYMKEKERNIWNI